MYTTNRNNEVEPYRYGNEITLLKLRDSDQDDALMAAFLAHKHLDPDKTLFFELAKRANELVHKYKFAPRVSILPLDAFDIRSSSLLKMSFDIAKERHLTDRQAGVLKAEDLEISAEEFDFATKPLRDFLELVDNTEPGTYERQLACSLLASGIEASEAVKTAKRALLV